MQAYTDSEANSMAELVLIVNHRRQRCGVHEFGMEVAAQLAGSTRFRFVLVECESTAELLIEVEDRAPCAIVFNYHPITMPWAPGAAVACSDIPSIGIIHDATAEMADLWTGPLFHRLITHDPDLQTDNPLFFRAPRPLPMYRPLTKPPETGPTRIGSFGFAAPDKGFDDLVRAAQEEFDECLIRLHMPGGDFADASGDKARELCDQCRSMIYKPGVSFEASHDFVSRDQLIEFLASNHINAFFYAPDRGGGGISSASDLALASGRPLALRRGKMFRNFASADPSIFVDDFTLADILANGTAPLRPFVRRWTPQAMIVAYEAAIDSALTAVGASSRRRRCAAARMIENLLAGHEARESALETRMIAMHNAAETRLIAMHKAGDELRRANNRLRVAQDEAQQNRTRMGRLYLQLRHRRLPVPRFNTLLDDEARAYYQPAIKTLFRAAPVTMQRKIPQANVQQGFMLAAVENLIRSAGSGRILCVGCFEDTAFLTLQALGYDVDGIDPELNVDLSSYGHEHPDKVGSYKVVFSTSVIEHVPDDEQFVRDLLNMATIGGVVVLTCDFRNDWTPDQQKPSSNSRIYTVIDMRRLRAAMSGAELLDAPDWLAHKPDFTIEEFGQAMRYGFATLTAQKIG